MKISIGSNEEGPLEISVGIFEKIIKQYEEEKLDTYEPIKDALERDIITLNNLREFSRKLQIRWELFLLDEEKFEKEMEHIEDQRKDKLAKEVCGSSRGNAVSRRLIDRYIRLQYFFSDETEDKCEFHGSLKSLNNEEIVEILEKCLQINTPNLKDSLRKMKKPKAFDFLIGKIEEKGVHVCRSHGSDSAMPTFHKFKEIYREMKGFYLADEKAPLIYILNEKPKETREVEGDDEQPREEVRGLDDPDGMCIYTLIYFFIEIGLGSKFSKQFDIRDGFAKNKIHKLVSNLFIKREDLQEFTNRSNVNLDFIKKKSKKLILTPSALIIRLFEEGYIDTEKKNTFLEELRRKWERKRIRITSMDPIHRREQVWKKTIGELGLKKIRKSTNLTPIQKGYLLENRYGKPDL